MTPEGKRRLEEELEHLRRVELPKNVKAIEEARAHGDLSENAEYHAAKERNAVIAAKISELETILSQAQVVDPLPEPQGRVVFGATVTLYDTETEEEMTYRVLGQCESDPENGCISISSPIARALLGKEEGDEVRVQTPGGLRVLEIVEVS